MFGTLGGQEIILILVIALIVFGPRKLPEIGKSVGRMMAEFRKASNDFRRTLEEEVEAERMRPVEPAAPLRAEPPPPVAGSLRPPVQAVKHNAASRASALPRLARIALSRWLAGLISGICPFSER